MSNRLRRGTISSLARVAWFHLRGERSGYVVVVADPTPLHATATATAVGVAAALSVR